MKCSLGICNFLKRSLRFFEEIPILLFFSVSLHWSLRNAFLSLLDILWNSAFRWIYLYFYSLPFASLLFSAICNSCSDKHFAFLYFFFLEMVLITASCTIVLFLIRVFISLLLNLKYLCIFLDNRTSSNMSCKPSSPRVWLVFSFSLYFLSLFRSA